MEVVQEIAIRSNSYAFLESIEFLRTHPFEKNVIFIYRADKKNICF